MFGNKSAILAGVGLLSLALSGCDKPDAGAEPNAAALVNGQAVAAAQIEKELEKIGPIPPGQSQEIANRILKNVVNQELLAQQATQAKLDALPEVQMKIAAARRQILAEAQITALTKAMATPTEPEIKAYFDAHPELFSKRRIYKLQELIATTTPENIDAVRAMADQAKGPRELAAALQAKGIPVGAREVVKTPEDLPTELLAKLTALKVGQSITLIQGSKLNLVILVGLEDRPVTMEQAAPMITRYLANTGKREHVEAELKKLRGEAKIEFKSPYGDFSDIESNPVKP